MQNTCKEFSVFFILGGPRFPQNTYCVVPHPLQRRDMGTPWWLLTGIYTYLGEPLGRHYLMNFTGDTAALCLIFIIMFILSVQSYNLAVESLLCNFLECFYKGFIFCDNRQIHDSFIISQITSHMCRLELQVYICTL